MLNVVERETFHFYQQFPRICIFSTALWMGYMSEKDTGFNHCPSARPGRRKMVFLWLINEGLISKRNS